MHKFFKKDPMFCEQVVFFSKQQPGITATTKWIYGHYVDSLYVRLSHRHFGEEYLETFEIANVNVRPRYRGLGIYSELLQWITDLNKGRVLFVENILDYKQEPLYLRRGYTYYGVKKPASMFLKN